MFKLLTTSILTCFLALPAIQAQVFVDTTARWHVAELCSSLNGQEWSVLTSAYYFKDSVMADGNLYYKLYRSEDTNFLNEEYTGFRYFETAEKLVFMENEHTEKLYIIYDFNNDLEAGDIVFQEDIFDGESIQYTIEAIDSIGLMNGQQRRRFQLKGGSGSGVEETEWIEGVGGHYSPMFSPFIFNFECNWSLSCFYQNGELQYQRDNCELGRETISSTEEPNASAVKVYPNPFSHELFVETTGSQEGGVVLTDIVGRPILRKRISQDKLVLNTTTLEKGMYFLSFKNSKGNSSYHPITKVE